jgi:hypothetical protein
MQTLKPIYKKLIIFECITLCLNHPLPTCWLNFTYCLNATTYILLLRLLVINLLWIILVFHLTAGVCWLHKLTLAICSSSFTNSRLDSFLIAWLVQKIIIIEVIIFLFLFIRTIPIKWIVRVILLDYQWLLPFWVSSIIDIYLKAIWTVRVIIIGWSGIIKR